MTVNRGATLNLEGISIVVNGAEFKSVIYNDGGTLNIRRRSNSTIPPCLFSNQSGRDRKPSSGGILTNTNNGNATIEAKFEDSSAGIRGGAITVDSGTVTIAGGSFKGNNALEGGAIFVDNGAKLNIKSSDFSINNNVSSSAGGAIYSHGGIVTIQRSGGTLSSVSIASNKGGNGGAISADGGKLSIDGIQFLAGC